MDIIEPITITDAILTGSNVPEADATEWTAGEACVIGDTRMVSMVVANIHKTYECLEAQSAGISADLLDEDCSDISDWTDADVGVGGGNSYDYDDSRFIFSSGISAAGNYYASRYRTITTPPNTFSLGIKLYHERIDSLANQDSFLLRYSSATWRLSIEFSSDGLYIQKASGVLTEVGTNIVKNTTTAAWQEWRFEVNKTTESTATVEVFLKEEGGVFVSQGTVDCNYEVASSDGRIALAQYGYGHDNQQTIVDYIKIGTGNGQFDYTNNSPVGNTKWLELGSTNRWKAFNNILGSQSSQATKIEYILTPGEAIDGVALMNLDSDNIDVIEIDSADNVVTNGESWTGASGTAQPTSWDKVGTPTDFTIEDGQLKITGDAADEGISQTMTVSAATEYQLLIKHKSISVDSLFDYSIYDVTHSVDIVAKTSIVVTAIPCELSLSKIFTTPAGCTSIKVTITVSGAGYGYLDFVKVAPTEYSETVTTGSSVKDVVKTDIPQIATGIVTVNVNKAGTAKIGKLVIGTKISLGATLASPAPKVSIADYSSQTQDTFGYWTVVQRGYAKKLVCSTKIEATGSLTVRQNSDYIHGVLSACRSLMRVWIGDENLSCMIVYGKWDSFDLELTCNNFSLLDLDILGMI